MFGLPTWRRNRNHCIPSPYPVRRCTLGKRPERPSAPSPDELRHWIYLWSWLESLHCPFLKTVLAKCLAVVIEGGCRLATASCFTDVVAAAFADIALASIPHVGIVAAVFGFEDAALAAAFRTGKNAHVLTPYPDLYWWQVVRGMVGVWRPS
jgi:hypothetical protein